MRGEHSSSNAFVTRPMGSSPHARGARDTQVNHRAHPGIIPACAGSTDFSSSRSRAWRDHPRMRGEHFNELYHHRAVLGSSPHARGARPVRPAARWQAGIIPACAGSTAGSRSRIPSRWDHPRMRGEHHSSMTLRVPLPGSSPHARGALIQMYTRVMATGIIPACAGNTVFAGCGGLRGRDHPRMRGEHSLS